MQKSALAWEPFSLSFLEQVVVLSSSAAPWLGFWRLALPGVAAFVELFADHCHSPVLFGGFDESAYRPLPRSLETNK